LEIFCNAKAEGFIRTSLVTQESGFWDVGILFAHNWDGGHEQLTSNGGRFNPAVAEREKKETMIDLRGISTNWFKNQLCPSMRLSRLRAVLGTGGGRNRGDATVLSYIISHV
jgi:hypothetical protein